MKLSYIFVGILSVLLMVSAGCKKCKPKETYSFSSVDKKLIPYSGNEILVLDFNNGSFDSLKGSGRDDKFYNEYNNSSNSGSNCSDYNQYEYNRFNYPTMLVNESAMLISLAQEFTNDPISYGQKFISIRIGATYAQGCFYANDFLFENDSIIVNNQLVFFDKSLAIGSQVYNSVYELNTISNPSSPFYITKVYYTVNEGIVVLKTNSGNLIFVSKVNK
ncbi:MAG: hypothetical protein ABSD71_09490 [Bacteroidales bacterium]